jgi:hypothetical protein
MIGDARESSVLSMISSQESETRLTSRVSPSSISLVAARLAAAYAARLYRAAYAAVAALSGALARPSETQGLSWDQTI